MYKTVLFQIDPREKVNKQQKERMSISNNIPFKFQQQEVNQAKSLFTLQQIKNHSKKSLINFVKKYIKQSSFSEQLSKGLEVLEKSQNLNKIFEYLFQIVRSIYTKQDFTEKPSGISTRNVILTVRSNQSSKLRIVRDEQTSKKKTKVSKQLQELQKSHEQLKKQLYNTKEDKIMLEKRLIGLIEQFKNRKNFYLAEIKKLTEIISMSSIDVRKLVLEKTKEAKFLEVRQQIPKKEIIQPLNFEQAAQNEYKPPESIDQKSYRIGNIFSADKKDRGSSYNTEIRQLKNVTSIQQIEEINDNLY